VCCRQKHMQHSIPQVKFGTNLHSCTRGKGIGQVYSRLGAKPKTYKFQNCWSKLFKESFGFSKNLWKSINILLDSEKPSWKWGKRRDVFKGRTWKHVLDSFKNKQKIKKTEINKHTFQKSGLQFRTTATLEQLTIYVQVANSVHRFSQ